MANPPEGPVDVPSQLRIAEAPRFRRNLGRASASLQHLAYQEVHNVARRYLADPRSFARAFDRVEQLRPETVLELKLGGGSRLLGLWAEGRLTLLDIGRHEVVSEYDPSWLKSQVAEAVPAGPEFWPSRSPDGRVFGSNPDRRTTKYGTETDPEWIYFLDDQQERFVRDVKVRLARASKDDPAFFFVVGGPGTGKTSILLKLLIDLPTDGMTPGLAISDHVAAYVESSGSISLSKSRIPIDPLSGGSIVGESDRDFDVLLFDDPRWVWELERAVDHAIGRCRAVVLAFDPSQLDDDLFDSEYERLRLSYEITAVELRTCYRQKETVGLAARRVMQQLAARGPYFDNRNVEAYVGEHELVNRISNELEYPNPYGYEQTYLNPSEADVRSEIDRVSQGPLWNHATPLLVVLAGFPTYSPATSEIDLDPAVSDSLHRIGWWQRELRGLQARFSTLYDLMDIKGLEFQHVFLILRESQYGELEKAPPGSNKPANRLMRIPFSRAKDSLVTFVLADA